jgi:hypothetical protein
MYRRSFIWTSVAELGGILITWSPRFDFSNLLLLVDPDKPSAMLASDQPRLVRKHWRLSFAVCPETRSEGVSGADRVLCDEFSAR